MDRTKVLLQGRNIGFVETKHWICGNKTFGFVETKHLFVGTQDLCVQSNKTGSNKTGSNKTGSNKTGSNKTFSIRMDTLDETLDWTGRKDLASLQTNVSCVPTNITSLLIRNIGRYRQNI
jgi:hypothetical protein